MATRSTSRPGTSSRRGPEKLQRAIDALDTKIWAYSEELYKDSMRCNTGQQPCKHGSLYHLTAAPVTKSDLAIVKQAL